MDLSPVLPVPGAILAGRFRVERVLGRGAQGAVLLAEDRRLGRRVALKLLVGSTGDRGARARLGREAEAAGRVKSPHVVEVYGVEEDADHGLMVASAYVEGTGLEARLRAGVPQGERMGLVAGLVEALAAIHRAGVLHRDLKPANLLIDRAGRVVLVDFGLARIPGETTLGTRTGALLGTPRYMAPEQLLGESATAAADVFAAGAVAFETLAGEPWARGGSLDELAQEARRTTGERRGGRGSGIEPATWEWLAAALARDPQTRTRDGVVLREGFSRVLPGASLTQGADGVGPRPDLPVPDPSAGGSGRLRPAVSHGWIGACLALAAAGLAGSLLRPGRIAAPPVPEPAGETEPLAEALRVLRAHFPPETELDRIGRPPKGTPLDVIRADPLLDPRLPLRFRRLLEAIAGARPPPPLGESAEALLHWPRRLLEGVQAFEVRLEGMMDPIRQTMAPAMVADEYRALGVHYEQMRNLASWQLDRLGSARVASDPPGLIVHRAVLLGWVKHADAEAVRGRLEPMVQAAPSDAALAEAYRVLLVGQVHRARVEIQVAAGWFLATLGPALAHGPQTLEVSARHFQTAAQFLRHSLDRPVAGIEALVDQTLDRLEALDERSLAPFAPDVLRAYDRMDVSRGMRGRPQSFKDRVARAKSLARRAAALVGRSPDAEPD